MGTKGRDEAVPEEDLQAEMVDLETLLKSAGVSK
ncbi:MAG: hypothetical protein BWZ02_01752 [Lentisphaerae bacterium ADurb.BinA184]|nr:MAG: hypothetical protein BWZ02_01752 [Lentisphaerae bacterium ADurb.BinA184]